MCRLGINETGRHFFISFSVEYDLPTTKKVIYGPWFTFYDSVLFSLGQDYLILE